MSWFPISISKFPAVFFVWFPSQAVFALHFISSTWLHQVLLPVIFQALFGLPKAWASSGLVGVPKGFWGAQNRIIGVSVSSHMLHVWNIYLQKWVMFEENAGKSAIYGASGYFIIPYDRNVIFVLL